MRCFQTQNAMISNSRCDAITLAAWDMITQLIILWEVTLFIRKFDVYKIACTKLINYRAGNSNLTVLGCQQWTIEPVNFVECSRHCWRHSHCGWSQQMARQSSFMSTTHGYPRMLWLHVWVPLRLDWFILCTWRSGGTAHEGGGCDQSIGSTVSDAIVHSWLWLTATRSSPLGCFSTLLEVVDNLPHILW